MTIPTGGPRVGVVDNARRSGKPSAMMLKRLATKMLSPSKKGKKGRTSPPPRAAAAQYRDPDPIKTSADYAQEFEVEKELRRGMRGDGGF